MPAAKLLCLLFLFQMTTAEGQPESGKIAVVIIDGRNNHDWATTTPVLKSELEETGLFQVDVATAPAEPSALKSFRPNFSRYKAIVLNYTDLGNGGQWSEDTQKAFVNYVENGGGVVVFHAASSAFPKWKEFNEIVGLGGWGGRDERSGPYVYFRNGKEVRDDSAGPADITGSAMPFESLLSIANIR